MPTDEPLPALSTLAAVTKERGPSLLTIARERKAAKDHKELQAVRAGIETNAAYEIFPWEVVEYLDDGARPLVLRRTETGCIVPESLKPAKSGYVQISNTRFKLYGVTPLVGKSEQLHRAAYRQRYGINSIPEKDYHVHHWCINPTCCNPDHLEALRVDEHSFLHAAIDRARNAEEIGLAWLSRPDLPSFAALAEELGTPLETVKERLAEFLQEQSDDRKRWAAMAA